MYVSGSAVTFTITRPKLNAGEFALDVTSVRAVDPDGVISTFALTTDVNPTTSAAGSAGFVDTLNKAGIWRHEILTASSVVHTIYTNVVTSETTYNATVKF